MKIFIREHSLVMQGTVAQVKRALTALVKENGPVLLSEYLATRLS